MKFYDNFISLCNKIGKTPSAVAIEIGLAKPTVNRWKNGSTPTDATLRKVADYFGVSKNQLLGEVNLSDFNVLMLEREGIISSEQSALLLGKPDRNPFMANALTENDAPASDPLQDNDVLFALFGGSDNITPEMIEDVKRFARYVKQEKQKK